MPAALRSVARAPSVLRCAGPQAALLWEPAGEALLFAFKLQEAMALICRQFVRDRKVK